MNLTVFVTRGRAPTTGRVAELDLVSIAPIGSHASHLRLSVCCLP